MPEPTEHDDQCEAEFIEGPMVMGPCECAHRRRLMRDPNAPRDTADYGPVRDGGSSRCRNCHRQATEHAPGRYSIYGVCPPAAELARIQTEDDLLAGLTAEVNRLAEAVRAAESKRDMEYHLACELASMIADHLDGAAIDPSYLHRISRRRVTAYRHMRGLGRLGAGGSDEFGPLPDVPLILHDGGDLARRQVIDVDPL